MLICISKPDQLLFELNENLKADRGWKIVMIWGGGMQNFRLSKKFIWSFNHNTKYLLIRSESQSWQQSIMVHLLWLTKLDMSFINWNCQKDLKFTMSSTFLNYEHHWLLIFTLLLCLLVFQNNGRVLLLLQYSDFNWKQPWGQGFFRQGSVWY